MKTNTIKFALVMGISSLAALPLMARPVAVGVQIQIGAPPPPVVIVQTPTPAVTVQIGVPDFYVWDGYEYVGLVGGVYFYLGPGNVWLRCEPWRVQRFTGWEKAHADWQAHATINKHYRRDAQGHDHPWQADRIQDGGGDHDHAH